METELTKIENDVLKAYIHDLDNLPPKGDVRIASHRTTRDIVDELSPMVTLDEKKVDAFMEEHEFNMIKDEDGVVKWAIWKKVV